MKAGAIILCAVSAFIVLAEYAQAAEPKSCSQAYDACRARLCDAGCQSTCVLRFKGCMKTGAFSMPPRLLLQNLKRN
jgi:hypothetical protein